MSDYPIGWTVGIEFETENIFPNDSRVPESLGFHLTHDSSIENPCLSVGGVRVGNQLLKTVQAQTNNVVGVELVSDVFNLETTNPAPIIAKLTKWLTENGESAQSERAGIHIHVGVGKQNSLAFLKTMLKWGMYLEDLFFRIGGNGYAFRGEKNEAAFCRPITRFGPPCIPYGKSSALSFNTTDLLSAKTVDDFWLRYGNTNFNSPPRYVAQRYTWLNFFSIPFHGTIEFRIFNKTLDYTFIMSEIELCHKLTVICLGNIQPPDTDGSVYDEPSTGELIDKLARAGDIIGLSKKSFEILKGIIELTPPVHLDPEPIITHLIDTMRITNPWDGISGLYHPVEVDNPKRIHVITIHNLRREPTSPSGLMESFTASLLSNLGSGHPLPVAVPAQPEYWTPTSMNSSDEDDEEDNDDDEEEPN